MESCRPPASSKNSSNDESHGISCDASAEREKSDKYGHIYQARAEATLYEIRVYSFSQKDASERRQAKRNCREWKARRRFSFSWKQNDLVFLVLHNQGDNTPTPNLNPTGLKWNPTPGFVHSVRSLERHRKDDYDDGENGCDPWAERRKRISAQVEIGWTAEHGRGSTMARKLDVNSPPSVLFTPNIRSKTIPQRERDRRGQQKKRKAKRAGRRAVKPASNIEQDQPAISPSLEDFTAQNPYDSPMSGWNSLNIHDHTGQNDSILYGRWKKPAPFATDNNSYWSPYSGWVEELVYTADGSIQYGTVYSTHGGILPSPNRSITS